MDKFVLIFFSFYSILVFSQPGNVPDFVIKDGINLNDISEKMINTCKKVNICSVGKIVIDDSTDLGHFKKLSSFESLYLEVGIIKFPEPSPEIQWKTKYLYIDGKNILKNIPDINALKNLKIIHIREVSKDFNIISDYPLELDSLDSFTLYDCKELKNINAVLNLKRLKTLELYGVNLLAPFPKFPKSNIIEELTFRSDKDISNLKFLKKLKKIEFRTTTINKIPYDFPKNIENIFLVAFVNSNLSDMNALNTYKKLKSLSFYGFTTADQNSKFYNKDLEYLEFSGKNMDLNFLLKFRKIDYLSIYGLDHITDFQHTRATTQFSNVNLGNIKNVKNINKLLELPITKVLKVYGTELTTIPEIKILKKIPVLEIVYNPFLNIDDLILSPDWQIKNNGNPVQ